MMYIHDLVSNSELRIANEQDKMSPKETFWFLEIMVALKRKRNKITKLYIKKGAANLQFPSRRIVMSCPAMHQFHATDISIEQ